jgi:hypothetical protein
MQFDSSQFLSKYESLHLENSRSKKKFYEYVTEKLVSKQKPLRVVETGTMWTRVEENAGSFTLILADLIKNYTGGKIVTIDISEDALNKCKENTLDFASHIEYIKSDSVEYLKKMSIEEIREVDLFFLDSYDLYVPDPLPSQIHHFRELLAFYDNVSEEALIAVDDNFIPGTDIYWNWFNSEGQISHTETFHVEKDVIGKGTLVDRFLREKGWKRLENQYFGENNIFLYEK